MSVVFLTAVASLQTPLRADVRNAAVKLYYTNFGETSSGSGVLVSPGGLVLTARHCKVRAGHYARLQDGRLFRVKSAQTHVNARLSDEVCAVQLDTKGDVTPYVNIATTEPTQGEELFACGHAGGVNALALYTGQVLDHRQAVLVTTQNCSYGVSGGPLFNMDSELVGICSAIDGPHGSESYWLPLPLIEASMRQAQTEWQSASSSKPQLVAFVAGDFNCPPCDRFKKDVAAGKFKDYDVLICSYYSKTGTWTNYELFDEAKPALQKHFNGASSYPVPTFWIRGTDHVRSGYGSDGPGGLIGWIMSLGGLIKSALVGPDVPSVVPAESGVPIKSGEYDRTIKAQIDGLKADAAQAIELAAKAKADLDDFKNSGPIGKLRLIDDLKSDVAQAKLLAEDARGRVVDVRENPMQYLWSILGGVLGLIKRRFLDRSEE